MHRSLLALAALITACEASAPPPPRLGVTNRQGETVVSHSTAARPALLDREDPRGTLAANALAAHDYARVLALTADAEASPQSPWLYYERGAALVGVGETDEALDAFVRAEQRFRAAGDTAWTAIAIWGRARALALAGRCLEATAAFRQYRALVQLADVHAAELAAIYGAACRPPAVVP